ncbi:class III extradiol ring-cleavage dioxygenase [Neobacillus sp. WH10]|uniref:DODA-type extradiol aromatic ring-opening family dioxygenase n=1 Tax=Neobacillus sp. WH10 TaxID=3047873 RepID=UPI0024C1D5E5|nr:class III extradiol ring-cleavage dioxygenase [Neobacillus sp. WH10]WHY79552.1 class III extradiol ring-cleavage dioxygenase [Neobacillus sp. WH10]
MMPSLFVAHGSPLLALENNEYTKFLTQLGQTMPRPKAVVLFSAHWESKVQKVSDVDRYNTIYDFGGFDEALYKIQYPAHGDHQIAKEIEGLFTKSKIPFEMDTQRGLDHGAWIVLRLLYPDAEIPVISMSVNSRLSPEEQYKIGKALSVLRAKDILIIASGGTVHNLGAIKWIDNGQADQWALEFDNWLAYHLEKWDLPSLFKYDSLAPNAEFAVPPYGSEHFIPIFYAMGAADDQQKASLLHRSFRYGNLSHSVWQFG